MESAQAPLRHQLVLGKYRVVRVTKSFAGLDIVIDLNNSIKMTCLIPTNADVREGDILTLYTEVLAHADPKGSSIQ